ncbi:hypothetical protein [Thioflexithrix psekupsensis]|uniref:Uncharacterized protein n=1 Tax=Thioflexithrix psekupsensis TaxID=1570016 RepID=A0A251X781_9GAMM|nr:hypothetical protein [Thioflexithrix psekupsensis]OUD13790.1 hypothetical protein TPSD3_05405 [Thioflexithrix psekupsensis]
MIQRVLLYLSQLRHNIQLWRTMPALFAQLLHDLFERGGFEVRTPLHYSNSDRTIQYQGEFRTLLQIDGDVTRFVPPPLLFSDTQWQQQYRLHYEQHCAELAQLNRTIGLLPWLVQRIAVLISFVMSLSATFTGIQQDFISQFNAPPWLFIILLLVAVFLSTLVFALLLNRVIRPLLLLMLRRRWRTLFR